MIKKSIHFLLLFLIINTSLFSQSNNPQNSIGTTFVNDVEHILNLGFSIVTSPFSFSANDWYRVGAASGGTLILFTIDKDVRTFAQSNQTELNDKIFNFDQYYGSGYTGIFTAAIYGYGLFAKNKSIRKLGLQTSEAFIYSVALTGALKILIGRRRPNAGESHLFFKPFQITDDTYQSLPSGHTAVSFAVSTVMANYSDNIFWKAFWFGSAGMVGLSRIYHNKHWSSDVFLGAVLGYFVGNFTINFDKETSNYFGINVTPYFTFNEVGINLRF